LEQFNRMSLPLRSKSDQSLHNSNDTIVNHWLRAVQGHEFSMVFGFIFTCMFIYQVIVIHNFFQLGFLSWQQTLNRYIDWIRYHYPSDKTVDAELFSFLRNTLLSEIEPLIFLEMLCRLFWFYGKLLVFSRITEIYHLFVLSLGLEYIFSCWIKFNDFSI